MDLSTNYLGLKLKNPLVPSASPLSRNLDVIRRMEDGGAAAVVFHSLFEEQIILESNQLDHYLNYFTYAFAEAQTWYPDMEDFKIGPEEYLESIRKAKEAVSMPVIGSLNGVSAGGWTEYARGIEQAGADAIELNIYYLPTEPSQDGSFVEQMVLDVLGQVKRTVSIPVAIKLSPYYNSVANLAKKLGDAGAGGLVLFNRFYQPDLDLESLEVAPRLTLSTSNELRLPLRWVAILYGRIAPDMAISGGIHTYQDVLKGLMAGAKVTMMASELLQHGLGRLPEILSDMTTWMDEREYESVAQLQGSMSQKNVADPSAFERANYMKTLQSWRPDPAGMLYRELLH